MNRLILLLIVCVFFRPNSFGQKGQIIEGKVTAFTINNKKDTISFMVADTNLNTKKPILLFCQGSMPIPLIIKMKNNKTFIWGGGISNFDYKKINEKFHIIVISKPHTPLIANVNHLNKQYCFIEDTTKTHSFKVAYQLENEISSYVERANKVLHFIFKQSWAKQDSLVVAGHSQGAAEAIGIVSSRKDVKFLGLFSLDPLGQTDDQIRKLRKKQESGQINWNQYEEELARIYQFVRNYNNPDSIKKHPYYTPWESFSKLLIPKLVHIKCPIYIAYGGQDVSAEPCSLLPIYFEANNKHNYTLKFYPHLGHNFFQINRENKRSKESNWPLVMGNFLNWVEGPK